MQIIETWKQILRLKNENVCIYRRVLACAIPHSQFETKGELIEISWPQFYFDDYLIKFICFTFYQANHVVCSMQFYWYVTVMARIG